MANDLNQPKDQSGYPVPCLRPIPGTGINVDGTSGSAQSAALDAKIIRIAANSDINILFGSNPTALTTSCKMFAGSTEYFKFNSGDKVAVLGGIANIVIME